MTATARPETLGPELETPLPAAEPRAVLRRCVSCRRLTDRRQLWRVIRLAGGGVALDRGMGRSAYLCPSPDCLDETRRRKRLQKALRCQVSDSIIDALAARLGGDASAGPEAR